MSHGSRQARVESSKSNAAKSLNPACERLEGRALLSFFSFLNPTRTAPVPVVRPSELSKNSDGRTAALYQLSLSGHPQYQSIADGHVIKAPMFSAGYHGPQRPNLDVIGASAQLRPQQGFSFKGKVLEPIDVTTEASYSFLVNRGGARVPGPLSMRPNLLYDAQVTVTTGPDGPAGSVTLLDNQGHREEPIPLSPEAVRIVGDTVKVSVPAETLSATSPPKAQRKQSRYSFAFTAGLPGTNPADIASFAPEYVNATIKVLGTAPRRHAEVIAAATR